MGHGKGIVLVQMHIIKCKQFNETNVNLHIFQQISDLTIFPECFHGSMKMLWQATCRQWACSWTTLSYKIVMQRCQIKYLTFCQTHL